MLYIAWGRPFKWQSRIRFRICWRTKGIRTPEEINYVLLSHLHPDHLGGASFFPNATFILTQEVYDVYKKPKLKDLIFKEFLPSDFEERLTVIKADQQNSNFNYRPTYDLFGDDSILVASIDGHAKGQVLSLYSRLSSLYRSGSLLGNWPFTLYETDASDSFLGAR